MPLIPASVSKPLVSVSVRKGHPMQHTTVRRAEAHCLREPINRKLRCLVFSSLRFLKKNVFQILLHAIRSFPHCQSLLQCLDGSHEFTGRLCSKPPLWLLPPIHRPLLGGVWQVLYLLPVWQPLWGRRRGKVTTARGLAPSGWHHSAP